MDINVAATQIVDRHVFCYVTPLIRTLAKDRKYSAIDPDTLKMSKKAIALKESGARSFWSISDWLGRCLEDTGELVDRDFYGLCVWARANERADTSLLMDGAILKIAKEYTEENY